MPSHLREVAFDLHAPHWTNVAVEQLGDVLCESFPAGVLFESKTDFGSFSVMTLEISVQGKSAPVIRFPAPPCQPHFRQGSRRHPESVVGGGTDPALDIAVFEPTGSHREKVWRRPNHRQLQEPQSNMQPRSAAHPSRGPGPRQCFPLFDILSSFHQITVHEDTFSLTALLTPTDLYEWLIGYIAIPTELRSHVTT